MARALERRNETWRVLHDYVLDERERFALTGRPTSGSSVPTASTPGTCRTASWSAARSRFNGVAVPDADRREYEASG